MEQNEDDDDDDDEQPNSGKRDASRIVFIGPHMKYLPSGNVMIDFLTSRYGWKLATLYAGYHDFDSTSSSAFVDERNVVIAKGTTDNNDNASNSGMGCLFDSLTFHNDVDDKGGGHQLQRRRRRHRRYVATFQADSRHASLGGPIHGGCQAVLMELAAERYCNKNDDHDVLRVVKGRKNDDNDDSAVVVHRLVSQTIEYLSPPTSKTIEIHVIPILHLGEERQAEQDDLHDDEDVEEENAHDGNANNADDECDTTLTFQVEIRSPRKNCRGKAGHADMDQKLYTKVFCNLSRAGRIVHRR